VPSTDLVAGLASATETTLASQLFEEGTKLERAFALKKWQHTELDGGRFAEVAARLVYGVDSGKFNLNKRVDACLSYIENNNVLHSFPDAKSSHQLALIIRSIYKLRSQRGAVHVSPTYTANEIDSRLVVEGTRWILAELVRVFVTSDQVALVEFVEELSRFPQPLIRSFGNVPLLQSVGFSVEEEILIHLLHEASGMTTPRLVEAIPRDASGVRKAIKRLANSNSRQLVQTNDRWLITDLGISRIESRIVRETET